MDKLVFDCLEECDEMIHTWMVQERPITRLQIEGLRNLLGLLEYRCTPTSRGGEPPLAKPLGNPVCSEPGCKATWKDGLLNYASSGFDPVWYCLLHVKPLEHSHHVPGQSHPIAPKAQRARDLKRESEWFLAQLEAPIPTR